MTGKRPGPKRGSVTVHRALRPDPCWACGLIQGNTTGRRIYRYGLYRAVHVSDWRERGLRRDTLTRRFGSISLCDQCVMDLRRAA